jgi:4-amino-4-deoxy-L-arabinose transferase-like glycosyltransferase
MNPALFLFFWSLAFCVAGIGRGSLASWDEAYYAIVSRGIFFSNEWVHLTYGDSPFYDKPPLYLWATALFYHALGVNEFATRLTSALAGVGTVLTTYFLGTRLLGRTAALAGAGFLLSSTDFLHYARWGTLDITHLFFFTLAVLFYLKSVERPGAWAGFWLAAALAVMTKGPLIVLAAPLILADSLARRDFSCLRSRFFWGGAGLFLALIVPWHAAVYLAHPDIFTRQILYKHYIARSAGAVEGHSGTWYFYIRTLINKHHPWIVLAPAALPWALWRARAGGDARAFRFLTAWVAVVLGFFTFVVKTKLQWYILPLYPALSLLFGAFAARFIFRRSPELWIKAAVIAALLLHIPFSSVIIQDYAPALKELSAAVRSSVPKNGVVFLYDNHEEPAARFYLERPVRYADSLEELDDAMRENDDPFFLLVKRARYDELAPTLSQRGFRERARTERYKDDLVFLARG